MKPVSDVRQEPSGVREQVSQGSDMLDPGLTAPQHDAKHRFKQLIERALAVLPLPTKSIRAIIFKSGFSIAAKPSSKLSSQMGVLGEKKLFEAAQQAIGPNASPSDILFVSRDEDRIDAVGSRIFDRMIDPIFMLAKEMGRDISKLSTSVRVDDGSPPRKSLAIGAPVFNPDAIARLDCHVSVSDNIARLSEFLIKHANIENFGDSSRVESAVRRLLERAIVFEAVLEAFNPKLVFLAVFDDPIQMALTLACHRRGVKVVDMQHGKQGKDHNLSTCWEVPQDGNELLPHYFWVWSEDNAQSIRDAMPKNMRTHTPVVGGNAWLALWKAEKIGHDLAKPALLSTSQQYAKRILVSLQPIAEPLHPTLFDAIANSPADWMWWVRLHRKQIARLDEIERRLQSTSATINIHEATEAPLYQLLMTADHHLTGWSTVAVEAEALGCPTTLFHPEALALLHDDIESNRFGFAATGTELLQQIRQRDRHSQLENPLKPTVLANFDLAKNVAAGLWRDVMGEETSC